MWPLEFGPEWTACWSRVSAELTRPDRVLGAMEFALSSKPGSLTKSLTPGDRNGLRILTVHDPISGRPVLFGVRIVQMPPHVRVEWVEIRALPPSFPPDTS